MNLNDFVEGVFLDLNYNLPPVEIHSSGYIPYGSNLELQTDESPEVLMSGSAGTGKSRACLEKIHRLCQTVPGVRVLIARKTRVSLTESALVTFERDVLGSAHPMVLFGASRMYRHSYDYPNGSQIVLGGLDKPTRIMSTEYDLIYVQEAIELTELEWESLSSRLRNNVLPYQQLLGDTNPAYPTHWLKKRTERGLTRMIYCRHEDNPVLYDPVKKQWTERGLLYLERLNKLSGVTKKRLRDGLWVASEGAVYPFDPAIHLLGNNRQPIDFKYFVGGIDWGFTNPGVLQVWGIDTDNRMYLVYEIYRRDEQILSLIDPETGKVLQPGWWVTRAHEAQRRFNLRWIACDPAEPSYIDAFKRSGLRVFPADNDILSGIQLVSARMQPAADGKPRLFLIENVNAYIDQRLVDDGLPYSCETEFPAYVWQVNKDGTISKEMPQDNFNHSMDVTRYVVNRLDKPQGLGLKRL